MDPINYELIKTPEECDTILEQRRKDACRKVKELLTVKAEKKDSNAGFNEAIKHLNEGIEDEIGAIDALEDRKKRLSVSQNITALAVS